MESTPYILVSRNRQDLIGVTHMDAKIAAFYLSLIRQRDAIRFGMHVENAAAGYTTVAGCLELGEVNLGLVPDWRVGGTSDRLASGKQMWFVGDLPRFRGLARALPLKGIFSTDAEEVNKFLASEGFSIRLSTLASGEYGMASVLKLVMSWSEPGTETRLVMGDGKTYEAAFLKEAVGHGTTIKEHEAPIVVIPTIDDKRIMVTELAELDALDGPELFIAAEALLRLLPTGSQELCGGLIFPKVSLDVQPDISWLAWLQTVDKNGKHAAVTQAVQQIKLEMDHLGAKVEEASAMGISIASYCVPRPPIKITKPFLVAVLVPVERDLQVAMVFRVGPDAWTLAAISDTAKSVTEDLALEWVRE